MGWGRRFCEIWNKSKKSMGNYDPISKNLEKVWGKQWREKGNFKKHHQSLYTSWHARNAEKETELLLFGGWTMSLDYCTSLTLDYVECGLMRVQYTSIEPIFLPVMFWSHLAQRQLFKHLKMLILFTLIFLLFQ